MRMVMAEAVVVVVVLVVIIPLPGFLNELKSVSGVSRAYVRVTEYFFDGSFLPLCVSIMTRTLHRLQIQIASLTSVFTH